MLAVVLVVEVRFYLSQHPLESGVAALLLLPHGEHSKRPIRPPARVVGLLLYSSAAQDPYVSALHPKPSACSARLASASRGPSAVGAPVQTTAVGCRGWETRTPLELVAALGGLWLEHATSSSDFAVESSDDGDPSPAALCRAFASRRHRSPKTAARWIEAANLFWSCLPTCYLPVPA